jgi:CRP-like cAMP-binding protein
MYFMMQLGSGQIFGELSVLDADKMSPYSVIAFTDVELHCFDSDILASLGTKFNTNTIQSLTESLNLHNPPCKLNAS